MEEGFYKKHRKSLILMIAVICFLSFYVGWYHGEQFMFVFAAILIPANILRLFIARKIFQEKIAETPETILRNTVSVITGLIPIYTYSLHTTEMYMVSYVMICCISAGIISLYSEKYKAGVIYIALLNIPFISYTFYKGTTDHRVLSVFVVLYLLGIINNLREIAKVQKDLVHAKLKAEHSSQAKSEFLAMMSHEIRTPLNGIVGMLQILGQTELDEEQQELVETSAQSSNSLEVVIDDILSFSKLEAKKVTLESIPFVLEDLIQEIVGLCNYSIEQKKQLLNVYIDPSIKQGYVGDPTRIKQVVSNLLSNANKFTHEHGYLELAAYEVDGHTRILISDTGIGMGHDQIENLFMPFSQADMSITRRYGGTGLGLTICKALIELMDGKISVESEINKGSKFIIEIPLIEACVLKQEKKETKLFEDNFQENYPHELLIVEDNKMNQTLMKKVFTKLGYEITFANNGQEAVEAVQRQTFTLIFMDMQMPVMDGATATSIITKELNAPPVVGLTANVLPEDVKRCIDSGMQEVIFKPLKIEELKQVLKKYPATRPKAA